MCRNFKLGGTICNSPQWKYVGHIGASALARSPNGWGPGARLRAPGGVQGQSPRKLLGFDLKKCKLAAFEEAELYTFWRNFCLILHSGNDIAYCTHRYRLFLGASWSSPGMSVRGIKSCTQVTVAPNWGFPQLTQLGGKESSTWEKSSNGGKWESSPPSGAFLLGDFTPVPPMGKTSIGGTGVKSPQWSFSPNRAPPSLRTPLLRHM